jgi:hypothetical protein
MKKKRLIPCNIAIDDKLAAEQESKLHRGKGLREQINYSQEITYHELNKNDLEDAERVFHQNIAEHVNGSTMIVDMEKVVDKL